MMGCWIEEDSALIFYPSLIYLKLMNGILIEFVLQSYKLPTFLPLHLYTFKYSLLI